jgi:hypothetical protein
MCLFILWPGECVYSQRETTTWYTVCCIMSMGKSFMRTSSTIYKGDANMREEWNTRET